MAQPVKRSDSSSTLATATTTVDAACFNNQHPVFVGFSPGSIEATSRAAVQARRLQTLHTQFSTTRLRGEAATITQATLLENVCRPGAADRDVSELFDFHRPPLNKPHSNASSVCLNMSRRQHDILYALSGCSDVTSVASNVRKGTRDVLARLYGITKTEFTVWFKNRRRRKDVPSKCVAPRGAAAVAVAPFAAGAAAAGAAAAGAGAAAIPEGTREKVMLALQLLCAQRLARGGLHAAGHLLSPSPSVTSPCEPLRAGLAHAGTISGLRPTPPPAAAAAPGLLRCQSDRNLGFRVQTAAASAGGPSSPGLSPSNSGVLPLSPGAVASVTAIAAQPSAEEARRCSMAGGSTAANGSAGMRLLASRTSMPSMHQLAAAIASAAAARPAARPPHAPAAVQPMTSAAPTPMPSAGRAASAALSDPWLTQARLTTRFSPAHHQRSTESPPVGGGSAQQQRQQQQQQLGTRGSVTAPGTLTSTPSACSDGDHWATLRDAALHQQQQRSGDAAHGTSGSNASMHATVTATQKFAQAHGVPNAAAGHRAADASLYHQHDAQHQLGQHQLFGFAFAHSSAALAAPAYDADAGRAFSRMEIECADSATAGDGCVGGVSMGGLGGGGDADDDALLDCLCSGRLWPDDLGFDDALPPPLDARFFFGEEDAGEVDYDAMLSSAFLSWASLDAAASGAACGAC
ncbi:hypothetical protein FOA52_009400 [Chlamydomonas sp. UWO 241]|nr:hypothetical protein FOA52_009400 [Chlamydomonas sp. UWO 241]